MFITVCVIHNHNHIYNHNHNHHHHHNTTTTTPVPPRRLDDDGSFRFCRSWSRLLKCSRCFQSRSPVNSGVGFGVEERISERSAKQMIDLPAPQVMESVEVIKLFPRSAVQGAQWSKPSTCRRKSRSLSACFLRSAFQNAQESRLSTCPRHKSWSLSRGSRLFSRSAFQNAQWNRLATLSTCPKSWSP